MHTPAAGPSIGSREKARNAMAQATEKQVRYALYLLRSKGYSTNWMDSRFKRIGATMRERSGKVIDWLQAKNVAQMSDLIDRLKAA